MTTLSAGLHRPMIVRLAIASAILITDRANSHLRLSPLLDDLVFATSLILRAGKAHRKSVGVGGGLGDEGPFHSQEPSETTAEAENS